ncbi:DUF4494 domain-containing protein [Cytophagaceae bacterium ABcell3]|nr:DUF4494 domain-containing protein [Cytophagaceae bacterium ABcell3]
MSTWFECKFKYHREDADGGYNAVTETYLIDAVSFTDAEARVYDEIGSNYKDFILLKVSKYRVHELVFREDAFTWYKCKVSMVTVDEQSGKEKKSNQIILVSGNNVKEAYDHVEEIFATSVSDYTIMDIVTTNIVEVLPYYEREENKQEEEEDNDVYEGPSFQDDEYLEREVVTNVPENSTEEEEKAEEEIAVNNQAAEEETQQEEPEAEEEKAE